MTAESDEFPDALVDALRQRGYIDLDRDHELDDWREVVTSVVQVLRQHGWTVAAPDA